MALTYLIAFITPVISIVLFVLIAYALILAIKALQIYIRKNS